LVNLTIEELRLRYTKCFDEKKELEDKAKNIVSTGATITSLVFGFVTFSSSVFKFTFPPVLGIILVLSIIASIVAILIAIGALRLQNYDVIHTKEAETHKEDLKTAKDSQLVEHLIGNYIDCIFTNDTKNESKGREVKWGVYFIFSSIVLVGFATILTLALFQGETPKSVLVIPTGAVELGNLSYKPNPITVANGDTITVMNQDSFIHTVTSGKGIDDPELGTLFDTEIINPGQSAEIVIANLPVGEYSFFCTVHPNMTGILKVIDMETTIQTGSMVRSTG
jgi:plastocyanin